MKEGVSLKQDMCYSRTKFCFPPSTIAAAFHSFELQRNIIALYGFLWALDLNNFTMNISNNYSCCFCWCGERLFFLDCWYCAIVFNIWGELRSYSSVKFKGVSCTHTLEHSLMSIMPVKTSWDLVWIIHFIQRFRVPVRSVYASLSHQKREKGANDVLHIVCTVYVSFVCAPACLCMWSAPYVLVYHFCASKISTWSRQLWCDGGYPDDDLDQRSFYFWIQTGYREDIMPPTEQDTCNQPLTPGPFRIIISKLKSRG